MKCLTAAAAGFSLVDQRVDGTDIHVTGTPGWNEGAEVDFQTIGRGGAHGTLTTPVYDRDRPFGIEGLAKSPTHLASEQLERHMGTVLAGGEIGLVSIHHAGDVALWVMAHRAARPSFTRHSPTLFSWRYSLLAPDPYRYGTTSTDSTGFASDPVGAGLVFPLFDPDGMLDFGVVPTSLGTVTVRNDGTADTAPVFSIAGPAPAGGFSIVESTGNGRLTSMSEVPTGSTLVIDARDGSAVLDGVAERTGDLIVEQWPTVPAGGEATFLFTPELSPSAAVLTAEVTSAYW